ncbi:MAG: hypothetical protein GXO49_08040 [Chlorobi bacterium]|nr:hypothetical protein [Chlorobiota bacterium]
MILLKYYKTIIVLIIVLLLSLLPIDTTPKVKLYNIQHLDKFVHFFMYFFLTVTSLTDIKKNQKEKNTKLILLDLFSIILLSGIIELIQENYILTRSGSWFDFLANITGVVIGTLMFFRKTIFAEPRLNH